jgi:hypothetical protein
MPVITNYLDTLLDKKIMLSNWESRMRVFTQFLAAAFLIALLATGTAFAKEDEPDKTVKKSPVKAVQESSTSTKAPAKSTDVTVTAKSDSQTTVRLTNQPLISQPSTASPSSPQAGEQINWQVIGSGGTNGTSTNYILLGTVGQFATGPGTSTNFGINQGFWQSFGSPGCCVGRTANVDAIGTFPTEVDLSDLGLMVDFLFLPPGSIVLPCVDEADVDALGGMNPVDLSDLGILVDFLFLPPGSIILPDCP